MKNIAVLLVMSLILTIALLPVGLADEFCLGDMTENGWEIIDPSGKGKANRSNGLFALTNQKNMLQDAENDLGIKALRDALPGDWEIDVQITEMPLREKCLHGLLIWKDAQNWLCFGKNEKGLSVQGVLKGADTGSVLTARDAGFLRIRKLTRGAVFSSYYFYVGTAATQSSFSYIGCFEDREHCLDDARYGLLASGEARSAAVYDYFCELVPDGSYSRFVTGKLDDFWHVTGCGARSIEMLSLRFTSENLASITRVPLQGDWRIDTRLNERVEETGVDGLLVKKDNENYLMVGAKASNDVIALLCAEGETQILAQKNSDALRFRITRTDNDYNLDYSDDGLTWQELACWKDEAGILAEAEYGVGHIGAYNLLKGMGYAFFRENPAPNGVIWDVMHLRDMGAIYGPSSANPQNETQTRAQLFSADLGSFLDTGDTIYMMLGDSFGDAGRSGAGWRSNVLMKLKPGDPADGLKIERIVGEEGHFATQVIPSRHVDYDDITIIPNYGVCVDGVLYYHCMAVYHWGVAAHWDCNGSLWAVSNDDGETFTKSDLLFAGDSNFIISALVHQDGFVYMFGIPSAKFGGIQLCRVPEGSILDRSAYRFYAGLDETNTPIWSTEEADAVTIVKDNVSEFSVTYNEKLDRYILMYMNEFSLNIILRDSENLWGEWSAPVVLADHTAAGFHYAPYTLPRFIDDDGMGMYFVMTNNSEYRAHEYHIDFVTK